MSRVLRSASPEQGRGARRARHPCNALGQATRLSFRARSTQPAARPCSVSQLAVRNDSGALARRWLACRSLIAQPRNRSLDASQGPANEVEVEEEWAALATSAVPLGSAGGPDRKGDAAIPDDDGEDDEDDAAEGVRSWWPGLASVAAGTKAVFKQQIVANDAYQRTAEDGYALPVFCVKGAQPGPTMLTLTGIHGDEYEPLAATHDLYV